MSHVRCPMCGLDRAVSYFEPSTFDRDIYVRQTYRKTDGPGFSYGPNESVLGDDVFTPKVLDRCIDLLRLFMEKDIITAQEVAKGLKIGVPIAGSDDIVPFEEFLEIRERYLKGLQNQVSSLTKQISNLSSQTIRRSIYLELREAHDTLLKEHEMKRKVDMVLSWLHSLLDSEITLKDGDWTIHVKDFDYIIFFKLCKRLYSMQRGERDLLESRIIYHSYEFKVVFDFFSDEPCIKSVSDQMEKNPNKFYYELHGLNLPQKYKEDDPPSFVDWETIDIDPTDKKYFDFFSGKPRLVKHMPRRE